jgi:hypothetical protein
MIAKKNNKKVWVKNQNKIYYIIYIEHKENSQLAEIRKLIQTYVKEEIRKIQDAPEALEVPRIVSVEKHRSAKSGSAKTSKSQTPK